MTFRARSGVFTPTVDAMSRVSPTQEEVKWSSARLMRFAFVSMCIVESLDGRLVVEKTEQKYEFKTDTKVGKVG
jgi:hypothetical protein